MLTACSVLLQVLAYSCVYSYYNQDTESMDIVEQQMESLELHTNSLQILLGKSCSLSKVETSIPSCLVQRLATLEWGNRIHTSTQLVSLTAPSPFLPP